MKIFCHHTSTLPHLVSLIVLWSISACAASPTPTISKEKAIQAAVDACRIPHMVLIGAPANLQAKLLTLAEADQLTGTAGERTNFDIPLDTRVWLVQMDGQLQLVGGPAPVMDQQGVTPTPPQPFWGTCSVILNADSGKLIRVTGRPK